MTDALEDTDEVTLELGVGDEIADGVIDADVDGVADGDCEGLGVGVPVAVVVVD